MQKNVWQLLTCVAANSVPENALVPCVVHYKKTSEVYKMPLNMTWGDKCITSAHLYLKTLKLSRCLSSPKPFENGPRKYICNRSHSEEVPKV